MHEIAKVDDNGEVTAVAPGRTSITIRYVGATIQVPAEVPQPVWIVPSAAALCASGSEQFYAHIAMPPEADRSVTWSLTPRLGSIDSKGLYTAPYSIPSSQRVTVTAASGADPTKTVSATVRLLTRAACGSR
jgi:hypothetical protein